MTTTTERAQLLAEHCHKLNSEPFLGAFTAQDLLDWIKLELGNTKILDQFINHDLRSPNQNTTKAIPNGPILHILSSNTPHAGLQSLLRGLLIGAHNLVKLPSSGLPEISEWIDQLPTPLSQQVTIVTDLEDQTFHSARTVIAIGSDATMLEIQKRISPKQRFIPHGHKLSIGLIKSPSPEAAMLVAQDACTFNQQGCLSLHTIYVMEDAPEFLPLLARAMQQFQTSNPRGKIGISQSGAISNLRELTNYEAANNPENVAITHSQGNTNWTAIYRNSPTLKPSVLNRVITIQPWPTDPSDLGPEKEFISTLAVEKSLLSSNITLEAPRICPLGSSQKPSLTWHHDGFAPLASLVRWQDIHYEPF